MKMMEGYDTECIDLRTTVGALLPWVGKMCDDLRHHTAGLGGGAEIGFGIDGIWIETHDEHGHPISEYSIPRNQICSLAEIYEDDQYWAYDERRLRYDELEELQSWLSEYASEQPITIELESDEGDVGIRIGGILNFFGYSECQRPENTKEEEE